ncbi:MAG: hypothetical protein AB1635_05540 [Acidobacteriota bacterium]
MRTMADFMRHVMAMPMPWPVWVALLFLTNAAGVAFLPSLEARVVLASLALGAVAQMALFARFGFVRLLGAGHAPWLAVVPWLLLRLPDTSGPLAAWVTTVIVACSVSLAIDIVDVLRFALGEREPTVVFATEGQARR